MQSENTMLTCQRWIFSIHAWTPRSVVAWPHTVICWCERIPSGMRCIWMDFCTRLHTKIIIHEVHVAFMITYPTSFQIWRLFGSLPSNSIVIFGGSTLGTVLGEVDHNNDLDIWCFKAAPQCVCCLLAAQGLVLTRLVQKYEQQSNPLISHVEQYCLQPAQEKQFRFEDHKIYGAWDYDDHVVLATKMQFVELLRTNSCLNRILIGQRGFTLIVSFPENIAYQINLLTRLT